MPFDPSQIKRYNALELQKLEYPEGHFIIGPRLLPKGSRWILGGETKIGKSWLLDSIARNIITGTPLWGKPEWVCEQGTVLLVEDEVGPYTTGERLRLAMRDVPEDLLRDNFFIYSQPTAFNLSDRGSVDWLKAVCKELKPKLLMLDPINKLHYFDDNSMRDMLRLVQVLKEFGHSEAATCVVHHYKKPPRERENYDPLDAYNFSGSSRFINDADVFLTLDRRPGRIIQHQDDADNWVLHAKFTMRHGSQPEPFRLFFNEDNTHQVRFREADCDPEPKAKKKSWGKREDSGLL